MKRFLIVFLTAAALIQLAGCDKKEEVLQQENESAEEYVYTAEYHELSENGYPAGNAFFGDDEQLYYSGITADDRQALFTRKIGEAQGEEIPFAIEENAYISGLFKGPEGSILADIMTYNEEQGTIEKLEIVRLSEDGSVIASFDATASLAGLPDFYIQAMTMDDKGNYYISAGQSLYVMNPETNLFFEISVGSYVSNLFTLKSGEIIAAYQGTTGWKVEQVDLMQKGLKALETSITFDYGTFQAGTETDLLYTQNSALYRCNLKDAEPERILNWVDSNVDSTYLANVKELSDGRIAAVSMNWDSAGEVELAVLTKKKRSEVQEKTVITYATSYLPYFTDSDIVAFNKQSEKYRVEVKQYGDENADFDTKADLMRTDIASGKGPDIIDLQYSPLTLDEYVSQGILEDLNPWLLQDEELKREDFVESVLKAYEREEKLYGIMPSFSIDTLMGKSEVLGDRTQWTLDELMEFMDSQPKDVELIPAVTKNTMLWTLCSFNQDQFINPETGECSFDQEGFIKVLEFAAAFPSEISQDEMQADPRQKISKGEAILLEGNISGVSMYQLYEKVFGGEVTYIGYPTAGEGGSIIRPNGTIVGMNASSENKEGVWEFVRFNLTKERQGSKKYANEGFSSRKDMLEKKFEEDMKPEYALDANGNQEEQPKSVWTTNDFTVDVYASTKEQVDSVREIIENARGNNQIDGQIWSIIREEAQAFFEGQKSAEEAASLIQSRAQIFANEGR